MGKTANAFRRIFQIWRLINDMLARIGCLENVLHETADAPFSVDAALDQRRRRAIDVLADELPQVEPFGSAEEVDEAREELQQHARAIGVLDAPDGIADEPGSLDREAKERSG